MDNPVNVPLFELLRAVPKDGRALYEHTPIHHQNIPYGVLCNDAANRILALESALREFCSRVEHGEIRSVNTYKKFKQLLEDKQ